MTTERRLTVTVLEKKQMRYLIVSTVAVCVGVVVLCTAAPEASPAPQPAQDPSNPSDEMLLAYGLGLYLGEEVRAGLDADDVEVDFNNVLKGFRTGLNGGQPAFSRERMDEVLTAVHDEMQRRMVKRLLESDENFKQLHEANGRAGRAYMQKFVARDGVQQDPAGFAYEVLAPGDGDSPTAADTIVVRYRATLVDGSVFDESERESIYVGGVLDGGRDVLMKMKPGARWIVVLPPELAYGPAGDPPLVGPNETVTFDVELLEVNR